MGELGEDVTTLAAIDQAGVTFDLPLAVGDRVPLFFSIWAKPDGAARERNIGRNGTVLEVREIRPDGIRLRNARKDIEASVPFEALAHAPTGPVQFTYGDVLSIDAAQGQTGAEHIDFMGGGSATARGFKAYVAKFRSRETTWLVLSDGAERHEISHRRPLNDLRPITEDDVFRNVAKNLCRQPEKGSALALLDRAREGAEGAEGSPSVRCRRRSGEANGVRPRTNRRERYGSAPRLQPTRRLWSRPPRMPRRS